MLNKFFLLLLKLSLMSLIGFSSHIAHATYPAEGTCIADITLNPELPTYFGLDNTANLTTPFFTTTATVNLTCTDTIYSEDVLFPVLEISGSNDIYPLLGGITGVSASLTNQTASSTCFKMQNYIYHKYVAFIETSPAEWACICDELTDVVYPNRNFHLLTAIIA